MDKEQEFEDACKALAWSCDGEYHSCSCGYEVEWGMLCNGEGCGLVAPDNPTKTLRRLYREARKDGERLDWLDKDYGINRMMVALNPNWNPGPTRAIIDTAMEGE